MPRRFRRSTRSMPRRRRPAYRRRRFVPRTVSSKMGFFRLVRRVPDQQITNTSTLGIATTVGSVITLGSPTYAGFPGYYHIPATATFKLSDIINSQDITNLFDKYKLSWVKIRVYCTSTTASAGSSVQLPSLQWIMDEDDNAMPTSSFLREKMGSKQRMFYPGKPISIYIRPKLATSLVNSSGSWQGNEVSRSGFINSSNADVPHFGLKMCILDANLNSTSTAYTQFKFDMSYCIKARDAQ